MTEERQKIAAIIPALNEEPTIGSVVGPLSQSPYIDEVIVVSDGSIDGTVQRARQAGATRVISHERPRGKGRALLSGFAATQAPIIMFLDADLIGLTTEHIEQVVLPVLFGSRVMNVGQRDKGRFITPITRYLPLISGERAVKREIIESIKPFHLEGYKTEVSLNYYCRVHGLRYGSVILKGLTIKRKPEKVGWWKGSIGYIKMTGHVVSGMFFVRAARLVGKF